MWRDLHTMFENSVPKKESPKQIRNYTFNGKVEGINETKALTNKIEELEKQVTNLTQQVENISKSFSSLLNILTDKKVVDPNFIK